MFRKYRRDIVYKQRLGFYFEDKISCRLNKIGKGLGTAEIKGR